ncbi:MAG: S-layer homology domain-containing protein [Ignavibacteriales bacterium]
MKLLGLSWVRIRPVAMLACACVAVCALVAFPKVSSAETESETWGPGWLKKMFVDEDEAPWAIGHMAKAKARGLITGYPGGLFKPNAAVTRAELIASAVRLIGEEDDARDGGYGALPFSDYSYIESYYPWAVGYLWEALNHGLLPPTSEAFRPYPAATRAWTAEVFVRALKMDADAKKKMDVELPFSDRHSVPAGQVGYVHVANGLGLMQGSGNMFNPNSALSRAEMAAILDRCDDYMEPRSSSEIRGVMSGIDEDDLEITVKEYDSGWWSESPRDYDDVSFDSKVTLPVMHGALVLVDKEHADLSDLEDLDDDCSVMVVKSGDYASVIDVHTGQVAGWPGYEPDDEYYGDSARLVEGTIRDIDPDGDYPTIRIRDDDGVSRTYDVVEDCEVRRDGRSADLEDLEVGDYVTLRLVSDEVTRITAEQEDEDEIVTGEITGISLSRERITVDTDDGSVRSITVATDADITRDGDSVDLEDLEEGDEVEVTIRDSEAISIVAGEDLSSQRTGTIREIDLDEDNPTIRIRDDDGVSKTYDVDIDCEVRRDGRSADLGDLEVGDYVTLRLDSGEVTRITAVGDDEDEIVTGEITGISLSNERITVDTDDGTVRSITVAPDADITRNGGSADLGDLQEGDKVEVTIRDSEAISIVAGEEASGQRTGTVTRVRTSTTPWRIYIETDSGSERSYDVSSSVTVDYDEMALEFEDVVEGDEVALRLVSSRVREITIEDRPSSTVNGTIQSVTSDDGLYSIKIRKSGGTSTTYRVHPEVVVKEGTDTLRMRDLDSGDTVTLKLEGDIVVRVTVIE